MEFRKQVSVPDENDVNYLHFTSPGGKNRCIKRAKGTVLPNCVGYAWGRFMDILGSTPTLSTNQAEIWYTNTADGYKRGQVPQLGAVICWRRGTASSTADGSGHVAIVEDVHPDGSIDISESGASWSSNPWSNVFKYTKDLKPPLYNHPVETLVSGDKLVFQGFIYNPACANLTDKLSEFVNIAYSMVGTGKYSLGSELILHCAKSVGGLLNVVIPNTFSAGDYARLGVANSMGEWLLGPHHGKYPEMQIGDIILFRNSAKSDVDEYYADDVGIVREVDDTHLYVVKVDSNGIAQSSYYTRSNSCINGYYRPNWAAVDSSPINSGVGMSTDLYESYNTRLDATIREVAYIDSSSQPSISTTDTKLSVINYTSALGQLFKSLIESSGLSIGGVSSNTILDELGSVPSTIAQYFIDKGLNKAACAGILANIAHESNFRCNARGRYVNGKPTEYGLLQWRDSRYTAMSNMCNSTWGSDLSGQLDYIWYELSWTYKSELLALQQVTDTDSGAEDASDAFANLLNNISKEDKEVRRASASYYYGKLVQQLVVE